MADANIKPEDGNDTQSPGQEESEKNITQTHLKRDPYVYGSCLSIFGRLGKRCPLVTDADDKEQSPNVSSNQQDKDREVLSSRMKDLEYYMAWTNASLAFTGKPPTPKEFFTQLDQERGQQSPPAWTGGSKLFKDDKISSVLSRFGGSKSRNRPSQNTRQHDKMNESTESTTAEPNINVRQDSTPPSISTNAREFLDPEVREAYVSCAENAYALSYGLRDTTRQNLSHLLYHDIIGSNIIIDIPTVQEIPHRILDLACGTGIWMWAFHRELIEKFPNFASTKISQIEYTGLDIAPIFLTDLVKTLPHFSFTVCDLSGKYTYFSSPTESQGGKKLSSEQLRIGNKDPNLRLPFSDNSFDFIHLCDISLAVGIDSKAWRRIYGEILRILTPGGKLVIIDSDRLIRRYKGPIDGSYSVTSQWTNLPCTIPFYKTTPFEVVLNNTMDKDRGGDTVKWVLATINSLVAQYLTSKRLNAAPCNRISALMTHDDEMETIKHARLAILYQDPRLFANPQDLSRLSYTSLNGTVSDTRDYPLALSSGPKGWIPNIDYSHHATHHHHHHHKNSSYGKNNKSPTSTKIERTKAENLRNLARFIIIDFIDSILESMTRDGILTESLWIQLRKYYRAANIGFENDNNNAPFLSSGECLEVCVWAGVKSNSSHKRQTMPTPRGDDLLFR